MISAPFYTFFTLWVVVIMILHTYIEPYVDIVILGILVTVVGTYISFVDPGYFSFEIFGESYTLHGVRKVCIVDAFHLLVLFCSIFYFSKSSTSWFKLCNALVLILVYPLIVDFQKVYHVRSMTKPFLIGIITICVYLMYVKDSLL